MMQNNKYIREENADVLGIYTGVDEKGRHSLFVKLKHKPTISFHSSLLVTNIIKRKDGLWAFQVSLTDDEYLGVFKVLINDLVDTVSQENVQSIAERKLIKRYLEWEQLFEDARNELLSEVEVIGLIGELYFIYFKLFPVFGVEKTINSWIGPMAGNQDFQFSNFWFEVKTKSLNSDFVIISNKNQLDKNQNGFLTVISYEKTSTLNEDSFNLYQLHNLIISRLVDKDLIQKYLKKLALMKFIPSIDYEIFSFDIKQIDYYYVDNNFPNVKYPLDGSISDLKYKLNLPMLNNFKKGEKIWTNIETNS